MINLRSAKSKFRKLRSRKYLLIVGAIILLLVIAGTVLVGRRKYDAVSTAPVIKSIPHDTQKTAPTLDIIEPADGMVVTTDTIYVAGTVSEGAKVTVNNVAAIVDGGSYHATIKLYLGDNIISVKATDKNGLVSTESLSINREKAPVSSSSISLTAKLSFADIKLNWNTIALDSTSGFYVLASTSPHPEYPANLESTKTSTITTYSKSDSLDGQTHYYRVCEILTAGGCGVYSNEVSILAQVPSSVATITITGTTGTTVNWDFSSQAYGGFVLLWSVNPLPTYPGGDTVFMNQLNPISSTGVMNSNVVSGQTYYVRVCENIGGKCGTYSNQVTVVAP